LAAHVKLAPGHIPHIQLVSDRNHRAIKSYRSTARLSWLPAAQHNRVGLSRLLSRHEKEPQAVAERDAAMVERKEHGLLDPAAGDAIQNFNRSRSARSLRIGATGSDQTGSGICKEPASVHLSLERLTLKRNPRADLHLPAKTGSSADRSAQRRTNHTERRSAE